MSIGHRFMGDELFEIVPRPWRQLAGPEKLPITDYARLLWMRQLHEQGHQRVVWLDADILMLDASFMPPHGDFMCRELWFFIDSKGQIRHFDAVNNCAMSFEAESPLLAWYLEACRVAPEAAPLPKLALGPDILRQRDLTHRLPRIDSIPTLSPFLIEAVQRDDERVLRGVRSLWRGAPAALHLAGSVADNEAMEILIDRLAAGF